MPDGMNRPRMSGNWVGPHNVSSSGMGSTGALLRLGRELRYRELPLLGQRVRIESLAEVEPALRALVAPWIAASAAWDGCDLVGGLGKYGLLDRSFAAPPELLEDRSTLVGIAALHANGMGLPIEPDPDPEITAMEAEMAAGCLSDLADDLGSCVLKVLLNDDVDDARRFAHLKHTIARAQRISLLPDYFPRVFTVTDACVTNSKRIWMGKHFYL